MIDINSGPMCGAIMQATHEAVEAHLGPVAYPVASNKHELLTVALAAARVSVQLLPGWFFAGNNQTSDKENYSAIWGASYVAAIAALRKLDI